MLAKLSTVRARSLVSIVLIKFLILARMARVFASLVDGALFIPIKLRHLADNLFHVEVFDFLSNTLLASSSSLVASFFALLNKFAIPSLIPPTTSAAWLDTLFPTVEKHSLT